jgi:hypothetical protein
VRGKNLAAVGVDETLLFGRAILGQQDPAPQIRECRSFSGNQVLKPVADIDFLWGNVPFISGGLPWQEILPGRAGCNVMR